MLKAIARIQTALAIAKGNGDGPAVDCFSSAVASLGLFAHDPYILPDVLTPADVPAAPVPTSIQEAHDMVQAGVITREDAVDSGVIQSVDQLPPHPDEVTPPVMSPANSQPDQSVAAADPAPTVTPPPEAAPTGEPANASVPQAGSDVAPEQVIQTVLPDAAVQPDIAPVVGQPAVAQADPGDEDPTPADKETIASLDKRIDQLERPTGKVSRQ